MSKPRNIFQHLRRGSRNNLTMKMRQDLIETFDAVTEKGNEFHVFLTKFYDRLAR